MNGDAHNVVTTQPRGHVYALGIIEFALTCFCFLLSLVPLIFIWATFFSVRLSLLPVGLIIGLIGMAGLGWMRTQKISWKIDFSRLQLSVFSLIFGAILVLRFADIHDLVLLLWVDSVHHS